MQKLLRNSILLVVISISLEISLVSGLECYQCLYVNALDQFPPSYIPPGFSYGQKCSTSKMPNDFKKDCSTTHLKNQTCGKVKVHFDNLPIWVRGCVPKDLLAPSKLDKCQSETLLDYWEIELEGYSLKDALKDYVTDPEKVGADTCFCDDKDGCNGAVGFSSGYNYIFMLIGLYLVTNCN